jgi:curli biogenesis system outer membrane secretion channel CsgG
MKFQPAIRASVLVAALTLVAACATESSRAVQATQPAAAGTTYSGPKNALIVGKFDNR